MFKKISLLIFIFAISGCGQTPSVAMVDCESQAYEKIGVKSDSNATLAWLQDKAEVVRVCMVKKGFNYKYAGDWGYQVQQTSLRVYEAHGVLHTPGKDIPSEIHQEANDKIAILGAKAMTSSTNWSK